MDNLATGKTVYILMPDFSVAEGKINGEKYDDDYRIETIDNRVFYRKAELIYTDEKHARARKFIKRFKLKLNIGHSIDDAWDSEDMEIVEIAIEKWPEELL